MARGLNRVQLIGNLGADPELRYTAGGQAVTNFRVAVNRQRRDQQGNAVEETEWFRVVAFDKLAELADQYLRKGRQVYVEGRLQTRQYTDREGIARTAVEVIAGDLVLLGRGEGVGQPAVAEATEAAAGEDVPF